ncbi:MAG: ACGX-repeat peptide [Alloprevotella sp.]|nr:ACGX-repeat peptide [Alloprevotella sp.]
MKRIDLNFTHSAQGVMKLSDKPAACGASCGSSDKPIEEKPVACGSACGAGEKPAACGTACGAGEK